MYGQLKIKIYFIFSVLEYLNIFLFTERALLFVKFVLYIYIHLIL